MGAITYFGHENGKLSGSSFAEPDGTAHDVELLEGNGKMILRIRLETDDDVTDLIFTDKQAVQFRDAVEAVVDRIGSYRRQRDE